MMTYEYFVDRLIQAQEEGWERALDTFNNDVDEGMAEKLPSVQDDEGFKYFFPYENDFCKAADF